MMVIPVVTCALKTLPKGLVKGLEDLEIRRQVEKIQQQHRLEYREDTWRLEETCCHSNSSKKKKLANAGVKNYQRSKIIILIKQLWLQVNTINLQKFGIKYSYRMQIIS